LDRNKELDGEINSLENALKVSEKQGSHMDAVAKFFGK
jgi:hypothetical protein